MTAGNPTLIDRALDGLRTLGPCRNPVPRRLSNHVALHAQTCEDDSMEHCAADLVVVLFQMTADTRHVGGPITALLRAALALTCYRRHLLTDHLPLLGSLLATCALHSRRRLTDTFPCILSMADCHTPSRPSI